MTSFLEKKNRTNISVPLLNMLLFFFSENLRYDQFCDAIRQLFGSDIKNQDLKALYRKISTNPDAKVDWSEVSVWFQYNKESWRFFFFFFFFFFFRT